MQFLILDLSQPRLALTPQGELLEWREVPSIIDSTGWAWRPVAPQELPEAAMAELLERLERCIPLVPGSLSGEALPAVLAASAAIMRRMAGALAEAA